MLTNDLQGIADDLDTREKAAEDGQDGGKGNQSEQKPKVESQLQIYKDLDENNVWRIKTKGYLSKI